MQPGRSVPPLSVRGHLPQSAIVPSLRTVAGLRGAAPLQHRRVHMEHRPARAVRYRTIFSRSTNKSEPCAASVGEKVTWCEHGDSMQDRKYSRWSVT